VEEVKITIEKKNENFYGKKRMAHREGDILYFSFL
jgi:hypothetical protein